LNGSILEPENTKGNDNNTFPDAAIDAHSFATMNVTLLHLRPLHAEDIPFPPSLLPIAPPPTTNEILKNLVNLLQQQNNRLKHVEKNQEKIAMEVATQNEEPQ